MEVNISGKQVDVGEALREHIEIKIRDIDEKYGSRAVDARVVISKVSHLFKCDCVAHLRSGLHAQAEGEANEPYAACDQAIARLEKQLRRYKRRLKDHHQRRKEPVAKIAGSSYVLASNNDDDTGVEVEEVLDAPTNNGESFWAPTIVAETEASIPSLSVGEAVMQMELADSAFLLFVNDARRRVNAVYRRSDGNIGWIDPHIET